MMHPRHCLYLGLLLSACGTTAPPSGQTQRVAPPPEARSQAMPEAAPEAPEQQPGAFDEDVLDVIDANQNDEAVDPGPGEMLDDRMIEDEDEAVIDQADEPPQDEALVEDDEE